MAAPKSGSPIVDEALVRIAALYKIEASIRGSDPEHRRAVRQDLSLPLVDEFFTWLAAQGWACLTQIRSRHCLGLYAETTGWLSAVP